jgi:hypothetical protein
LQDKQQVQDYLTAKSPKNDIRLMALFCIIKHDREEENPASKPATNERIQ